MHNVRAMDKEIRTRPTGWFQPRANMSLPMPQYFHNHSLRACVAVATFTGLLASAPAQAVNLSQTGQGQVLIFPYYSVRGGTDSYLSVINNTDRTKALSVRLRESRNGRSVSSLTLFLAPFEMWTAGVTATAEGAKLITTDRSCTSPRIPPEGLALSNVNYTGAVVAPGFVQQGNDGGDTSLDRVREGFIEVIELGEVTSAFADQQGLFPYGFNGLQPCNAVELDRGPSAGANALAAPSGGLSGSGTLVNVAGGSEYSYEPLVLDDFSDQNLWPASRAQLSSATPKISRLFDRGRLITSTWTRGEDAVSAVLMRSSLTNEFVLETTTLSGTDWLVNMPTKHYYVPVAGSTAKALPPFAGAFSNQGACQFSYGDVQLVGREGEALTPEVFLEPQTLLCGETSVLTFNGSQLLASAHGEAVGVKDGAAGSNGFGRLDLGLNGEAMESLEGHVYRGLPVNGFMVRDFINGNVNGVLSNYGGSFAHKYQTDITTP
ncbi:MAG: hypothetical protein ABWY06_23110 [Pseudomonas sp.]|uniref:hypothetical protein n=1 Tax=Pseudomonas sp. TaxID=306 RepID=UPI003391DD80